MRSVTRAAAVLLIACAGLAGTASAQIRTEPAGKLFFEGDIVRHAVRGMVGPFCVLQNRFMRGEAVAWRLRVLEPDGSIADDSVLSSVVVELGNGETIDLDYGPHGDPPTDYFWASSWTIPANHPTGTLGYKVTATLQDGSVVTWEPFTRPGTQLMIVEGTPAMQAAAQ